MVRRGKLEQKSSSFYEMIDQCNDLHALTLPQTHDVVREQNKMDSEHLRLQCPHPDVEQKREYDDSFKRYGRSLGK